MSAPVVLGVTAALIHAAAYIIYNLQTRKGTSTPNPVSWSIWAFSAILNAATYSAMTGIWAALQSYTGSVFCFGTFLVSLVTGKFGTVKRNDAYCFVIGIIATLLWWKFKSAAVANYLILVSFLISFWPTFSDVRRNPTRETPLSWVLWTVAFAFTCGSVIVQKKWLSLPMPVILLLAHGSIAVLSRRSQRFSIVTPPVPA